MAKRIFSVRDIVTNIFEKQNEELDDEPIMEGSDDEIDDDSEIESEEDVMLSNDKSSDDVETHKDSFNLLTNQHIPVANFPTTSLQLTVNCPLQILTTPNQSSINMIQSPVHISNNPCSSAPSTCSSKTKRKTKKVTCSLVCTCNDPECNIPKWIKQTEHIVINEFQNTHCGPVNAVPDEPLLVFNQYFTDHLIDEIVFQTNLYAKEVLGATDRKWETTSEEIRAYLGFHILKGINVLPSNDDYWRQDSRLYYHPIASQISRDRFREIDRFLHFVDNQTLPIRGTPEYDRLGKVRPIIDFLSIKFQETYQLNKEVAVDEAMIGRSTLKQYMPMKPVKRGIKVWVLADSTTGYFWKFKVYTGKGDCQTDKSLGGLVVCSLTKELQNKYHHVYFDNFFTSPDVLIDLHDRGIYSCGTARKDRKGFPDEFKSIKLKER